VCAQHTVRFRRLPEGARGPGPSAWARWLARFHPKRQEAKPHRCLQPDLLFSSTASSPPRRTEEILAAAPRPVVLPHDCGWDAWRTGQQPEAAGPGAQATPGGGAAAPQPLPAPAQAAPRPRSRSLEPSPTALTVPTLRCCHSTEENTRTEGALPPAPSPRGDGLAASEVTAEQLGALRVVAGKAARRAVNVSTTPAATRLQEMMAVNDPRSARIAEQRFLLEPGRRPAGAPNMFPDRAGGRRGRRLFYTSVVPARRSPRALKACLRLEERLTRLGGSGTPARPSLRPPRRHPPRPLTRQSMIGKYGETVCSLGLAKVKGGREAARHPVASLPRTGATATAWPWHPHVHEPGQATGDEIVDAPTGGLGASSNRISTARRSTSGATRADRPATDAAPPCSPPPDRRRAGRHRPQGRCSGYKRHRYPVPPGLADEICAYMRRGARPHLLTPRQLLRRFAPRAPGGGPRARRCCWSSSRAGWRRALSSHTTEPTRAAQLAAAYAERANATWPRTATLAGTVRPPRAAAHPGGVEAMAARPGCTWRHLHALQPAPLPASPPAHPARVDALGPLGFPPTARLVAASA
jgi:hypothetical protein